MLAWGGAPASGEPTWSIGVEAAAMPCLRELARLGAGPRHRLGTVGQLEQHAELHEQQRLPRMLKSRHANVSIGLGLFPRNGGNLADCAAGKYAGNFRTMGERLRSNGVGDAEIRLGWEASNAGYPWTAVGKSADPVEGLLHQRRQGAQGWQPEPAHRLAHGQEGQDQRQHDLARRTRRSPISASAIMTTHGRASAWRPP